MVLTAFSFPPKLSTTEVTDTADDPLQTTPMLPHPNAVADIKNTNGSQRWNLKKMAHKIWSEIYILNVKLKFCDFIYPLINLHLTSTADEALSIPRSARGPLQFDVRYKLHIIVS